MPAAIDSTLSTYVVETTKPFDETVEAVQQLTSAYGFSVVRVHDVAATLASKGIPRQPLKILEVCNARSVDQLSSEDVRLAVTLPCPICIYAQNGRTFIGTFLPTAMARLYPGDASAQEMAATLEKLLIKIVNEARQITQ